MNRILQYISRGKGVGALLVLAFAFIVSVYFSISSKFMLTESIPYLQEIADNVLPIKVVDGKVTIPENTVKEFNLFGNDNKTSFPFVIDTTKDTIDTGNLPQGVYLSRSYVYAVSNNKVESYKLTGSFDLPQQDYTPFFQSTVKWVVIIGTIMGTLVFFVIYFILTIFYAFCAGLSAVINKKDLTFDAKMRLSAVCIIVVYILSAAAGKIGVNINLLAFFLIMIALQIVIVKKLPQ